MLLVKFPPGALVAVGAGKRQKQIVGLNLPQKIASFLRSDGIRAVD